MTTREMLLEAKKAASGAMELDTETKNRAIEAMACAIERNMENILKANAVDMENAKNKLSASMLDRLKLDEKRIYSVTAGMRKVMELADPVGRILSSETMPNGLLIEKITVPMGVVAIIYESRPNVTADAAVLCFKSSNVCVLRCGRDSFLSAKAIVDAMREGLEAVGLKKEFVNLVPDPSRESATELMKAEGLVDLLIPRGGAGLIKSCVENATVPCIRTGTGICHIFVDKSADFDMALNIIENAKCQRPSVCNAAEVLLVHKDIAGEFLPLVKKRICLDREKAGLCPVKLLGDEETVKLLSCEAAKEGDFDTEFLDYVLAVKTVDGVKEAVEHISLHSTGHSEAILSFDDASVASFVNGVDSAAVYVNASTRFTDGGEFGLGCEMGIATQKLHARGPMGLRELVSYKYLIKGNGQIRG